ncbi:mitochondrial small ribosomal subunit Rsm22-domain-containing protein [Vararia minispora EC-137]|uniref:Mitochondrial small ribosomal subunit Rsm22-domain-containing protein n=1 Tax=Vararia minispora EC-137 TaxID=1314806 RepID=A0ACB8QTE9_9AGAM|nr:mitochondrial small ribosomal subunit Rsm22-domain-containing protein [Vararia minispora EC-137]
MRRVLARPALRPTLFPQRASLSVNSGLRAHQPNAPLDLDPAFKTLLRDVDSSLSSYKRRGRSSLPPNLQLRELEELEPDEDILHVLPEGERLPRRSPAARFGSQNIGAIVLPEEMQKAIYNLVEASDKGRLRADAMRLFKEEESENGPGTWHAEYNFEYKSPKQAFRHGAFDGTAFATIALPGHYSAIYTVLNETRNRLGRDWFVDTVYDWGSGTGSALWCTESTLTRYTAIEARKGLALIGQQLLDGVDIGKIDLQWKKSFSEGVRHSQADGKNSLAISSFYLSCLQSVERKKVLKSMWESGADVMVLIDHSTPTGFNHIIEAREYLLNLGKREAADDPESHGQIVGAHVLAPCPHDGDCPIFHDPASARLVCGFKQRMQRPGFVRYTKHSGVGHEDMGYSYVVIRRGPRPEQVSTNTGRVGGVGRAAEAAATGRPMVELEPHADSTPESVERGEPVEIAASDQEAYELNEEMREKLQHEAFQWPRLVFPPLKRSGHMILDVCSAEGKILRTTIPKSQGKQPYYDARKAEWGDIFPHPPKNPPQVRFSLSGWDCHEGERPPWRQDGKGKDKKSARAAEPEASYAKIIRDKRDSFLEKGKASRRERRREEKDLNRELRDLEVEYDPDLDIPDTGN